MAVFPRLRRFLALSLIGLAAALAACAPHRSAPPPPPPPAPAVPAALEGRYLYGGPSSAKQVELYTCFHSPQCFEALDTALVLASTDPRVGLVVRLVPRDAAEKAFSVRLVQLVQTRPEAARSVFSKMARHWRLTGRIGLGDFLALAAPEVLGVPIDGPPAPVEAEAVVSKDIRAFGAAGGRVGPLVLLHGIRVPPEVLLR